jgi:hypothetical protein
VYQMSKGRYGWEYITQTHRLHSGGRFTEVLVNEIGHASEPLALFYGPNAKLNARKFIFYSEQEDEKRHA